MKNATVNSYIVPDPVTAQRVFLLPQRKVPGCHWFANGSWERNEAKRPDGSGCHWVTVCACFLVLCCCGCQFPYKIDPSGNCLFVKNEDATLPEFKSPYTATQNLRPNEPAVSTSSTVPASPDPTYQSSVPGVSVSPGTASGIAPSTNMGVIGGGTTQNTSTLLVPGAGPIVLVTPDEQIALIGSEVILFANYKGDDDYLRIGERIEWSLGGVGHIQTTNKTQCSNVLALDFNKDKKVSDRFAVTSTLHYEGTIDRGSADEQGKVPHLAGQSWISIQSAEEGTSTVTAFAPTIKDWNRRTSSATVHWIDAEWVYPRTDITKYDRPKIFVTQVKKRSSGSPSPNWVVRYEVINGPNAGFGPGRSKVVEVSTNDSGEAAVEFNLLEGNSGVSTIKVTIIRPAGVDGGTKRLELHSATVTNHWSPDLPLTLTTIPPRSMRWGGRADWAINVSNRSEVTKTGTVTLPLPAHLKLVSSTPTPNGRTQQANGGELLTWNLEFRPVQTAQIQLVLQDVTDDPMITSKPFEVVLEPKLSMFTGNSGMSGTSDTGNGSPGVDYGGGSQSYTGSDAVPPTYVPSDISDVPGMSTPGLGDTSYGGIIGGTGTPSPSVPPGHCDPNTFANMLKCEFLAGGMIPGDEPTLVTFNVTNNATIPFYKGLVQVTLPEGLAFIDENGRPIMNEDNSYRTIQDFYFINQTRNEIAIQQGKTHSIMFNIVPTKTGVFTINALIAGQSPNSTEWEIIAGTQQQRTVSVNASSL